MTKTTPNPIEPVPADLPAPEADPIAAREHAALVAAADGAAHDLDEANAAAQKQREALERAEAEEREAQEHRDSIQQQIKDAIAARETANDELAKAIDTKERNAAAFRAAFADSENVPEAVTDALTKAENAVIDAKIATNTRTARIGELERSFRAACAELETAKNYTAKHRGIMEQRVARVNRCTTLKATADAELAEAEGRREERRKAFSMRFPVRCTSCKFWIPIADGLGECHAMPPGPEGFPKTAGMNACGRLETA